MRILPIASDGWRFVLPAAIVGAILIGIRAPWSYAAGGLALLIAVFCAFFFRDFEREIPADPLAIVSPGDGTVVDVSPVADGEYASGHLIRIFLSVLDGHVQRSPVAGTVKDIHHKTGKFFDARDLRAHVENEQSVMTLSTEHGAIVVTQIAGLIARRIVTWARSGETLAKGQRYGLIRFGSQVDVLLPRQAEVTVKAGDKVLAGANVIARWHT